MRTLGFGGLAALLLAGPASTAATAADEADMAPPKQSGLRFGHTGLFGKPRPAEPTNPTSSKEAQSRPVDRETQVVARREREFNAYLRRMDACDRLMEIAIAANNEPMQRKVEQLSERVWAVYQQNTGGGASRADGDTVKRDEEASSGRSTDGSERPAKSGSAMP